LLLATPFPVSAQPETGSITADRLSSAGTTPSEKEASLLAVLAPIREGEALLVPGDPSQVFPHLVEIHAPTGPPLAEQDWLSSHGIRYVPPQRDPVIAEDYNPVEGATRVVLRLDEITTMTPGVLSLTIHDGEAFFRGLDPGPYCLILPGARPLATTTEVAGPVTLVQSDSWEPLLYQYYVSILRGLNESAFKVALSPAPLAQVNPLIRRLRSSKSVSPVELYIFYRGYYEGLALTRWVETSPEGRLTDFLNRLNVPDAYIDQLVGEALRQQQPGSDLPPIEPPGTTPASTPEPGAVPPWEAATFESSTRPGLSHYRSFYMIGLATFFFSESTDKAIPASSGEFFHPEEAQLYEEEYQALAIKCLRWAQAASPGNPLLSVLRGHMEFGGTP